VTRILAALWTKRTRAILAVTVLVSLVAWTIDRTLHGPRAVEPGDAAVAARVLVDLPAWDAATCAERRAAAVWVGSTMKGFVFERLERFGEGEHRHEIGVFTHGATGLEFSLILGGTFEMGSPEGEVGRSSDETQHAVTIAKPFLLCRTETPRWRPEAGSQPTHHAPTPPSASPHPWPVALPTGEYSTGTCRMSWSVARRTPSALSLADIDAPFVLAFLDHLEQERGNSPRTRNLRLTAIRSFMRYASVRDPASLPVAQRVLAIPEKRFDRRVLTFLTREEVAALLDAPDRSTWSGQRDAVLLATLYNTGARVSEMTGLRIGDVLVDRQCAVRLRGKGRKERAVPLWKSTAAMLREWLPRIDHGPDAPVFPNRHGKRMSRSGVEDRLRVALATASKTCPSLATRRISPHTMRHTTAMHLLQAGVDITVIALWLGHEDPATTHHYVEADLAMKIAVLRRVEAPSSKPVRFQARDRLLAFLDAL
jgi:site-specific recombinase XerD